MISKSLLSRASSVYAGFCKPLESLKSPFLLLIRLYWGWQFLLTGYGKLTHIHEVTDFFFSLGIPYPMQNAYLVGNIEMLGGTCLLLGLASRLVSIPLTGVLLTAYFTAHVETLHDIFNDPKNFTSQEPFPFLYTVLVILIFGPGVFSLDGGIKRFWVKKQQKAKVVL